MKAACMLLALLVVSGSGCHSLNRTDPSGPRGAFAGTTAATGFLAEATSAALIGRTFDGEKVPMRERPLYAGMGTAAAIFLPGALVMDLINGPTE